MESSNAVAQINASLAQSKIDASNAMIASKSTSDFAVLQMKLENAITLAASKNASDAALSQIKMELNIAAAQVNASLVQTKIEANVYIYI